MDKITIKSLKFHGKHGYYDHERTGGNEFELDVTAEGEFKKAIKDDDLTQTFDYEQVQFIAAEIFSGPSRKLIESLCHAIGEKIFAEMPLIRTLTVSLRKINPPLAVSAQYAEITMTWNR